MILRETTTGGVKRLIDKIEVLLQCPESFFQAFERLGIGLGHTGGFETTRIASETVRIAGETARIAEQPRTALFILRNRTPPTRMRLKS